MAISIEGFSVVAQRERIQALLDSGSLVPPNATSLADDDLWKCSFMAKADAQSFMRELENRGLNTSRGPDSDAVIVDEFHRSIEPYCEWLKTGLWEKALIAWKVGTRPDKVTAREGWDPKVGSGFQFHDPSTNQSLQFLRLENNVEVYLNNETGKEVYIGRTSTSVDALFQSASEIMRKHNVTAGEPPRSGAAAAEASNAARMLAKVIAEAPDRWNAQWLYGKSQLALGNYEPAYEAFRRAYELEKTKEIVLRELAGACLELRRFDEAVKVTEEALALDPTNPELLGNLAVGLLLAGRIPAARKAIDAASQVAPHDQVNQTISRVLREIEDGRREQPQTLRDLTKPAKKPRKWSLFGFFSK